MKKVIYFFFIVQLFLITSQASALEYVFSELAGLVPGRTDTLAFATNDNSQVVGHASIVAYNHTAVLWEDGNIIDLPGLPGANWGRGRDINNSGLAVGVDSVGSYPGHWATKQHAVYWKDGNITDIHGYLNRSGSTATGVNEAGKIVGNEYDMSLDPFGNHINQRAFLFDSANNSMMNLNSDLGRDESYAYSINDIGQVVGSSWDTGLNDRYGYIWANGSVIELQTLGGTMNTPCDINNNGQVVGASKNDFNQDRAYLWEDGSIIDLGTLGGNYSSATDINDFGQIVGNSKTVTGEIHGFLWMDGIMRDLLDITQEVDGYDFKSLEAFDINIYGQIVGMFETTSGMKGSFLLTPTDPVPEPATMLLLGSGLIGLAGTRRKFRK